MDSLAPFVLDRPASARQAVALAIEHPEARFIAGGTDLLPNLRRGLGAPRRLVDLSRLPGFDSVDRDAGGWRIGAGATLARLAADPGIAAELPAVAQAASMVAGPSHRTVATLGGNLCQDTRCVFYNQGEWWRRSNDYCLKYRGTVCHVAPQGDRCHAAYCGDLAPALIVSEARIELLSPKGSRELALEDFYRDDGARALAIEPGELVCAVRIPHQPAAARAAYRKARVRGAMDFPLAGVAMRVGVDPAGGIAHLRVALTGTNACPLLLRGTDALCARAIDDELLATLGTLVQKQVSPMRTMSIASNYRRQVASVHARRLLRELLAGA